MVKTAASHPLRHVVAGFAGLDGKGVAGVVAPGDGVHVGPDAGFAHAGRGAGGETAAEHEVVGVGFAQGAAGGGEVAAGDFLGEALRVFGEGGAGEGAFEAGELADVFAVGEGETPGASEGVVGAAVGREYEFPGGVVGGVGGFEAEAGLEQAYASGGVAPAKGVVGEPAHEFAAAKPGGGDGGGVGFGGERPARVEHVGQAQTGAVEDRGVGAAKVGQGGEVEAAVHEAGIGPGSNGVDAPGVKTGDGAFLPGSAGGAVEVFHGLGVGAAAYRRGAGAAVAVNPGHGAQQAGFVFGGEQPPSVALGAAEAEEAGGTAQGGGFKVGEDGTAAS